jgi:hypothetical protein
MLNKFTYSFIAVLLLYGCSTPIATTNVDTVYIYQPALIDTVQLYDSLLVNDSTWYGKIRDSLDGEIGELTVYWKKKLASIKLKERIDTVFITRQDTVQSTTVLETISGFLNWWEEAIVLMVAMLLLTWKAKRKLPIV